MLDLIDQATAGRQGERTDLFDNVKEVPTSQPPTGNSNQYAIRKLRKESDAAPEVMGRALKEGKHPSGQELAVDPEVIPLAEHGEIGRGRDRDYDVISRPMGQEKRSYLS